MMLGAFNFSFISYITFCMLMLFKAGFFTAKSGKILEVGEGRRGEEEKFLEILFLFFKMGVPDDDDDDDEQVMGGSWGILPIMESLCCTTCTSSPSLTHDGDDDCDDDAGGGDDEDEK